MDIDYYELRIISINIIYIYHHTKSHLKNRPIHMLHRSFSHCFTKFAQRLNAQHRVAPGWPPGATGAPWRTSKSSKVRRRFCAVASCRFRAYSAQTRWESTNSASQVWTSKKAPTVVARPIEKYRGYIQTYIYIYIYRIYNNIYIWIYNYIMGINMIYGEYHGRIFGTYMRGCFFDGIKAPMKWRSYGSGNIMGIWCKYNGNGRRMERWWEDNPLLFDLV